MMMTATTTQGTAKTALMTAPMTRGKGMTEQWTVVIHGRRTVKARARETFQAPLALQALRWVRWTNERLNIAP